MKALTVWEPYAYAIALGFKLIENRTWATLHRGLLAVHASKRVPDEGDLAHVADLLLESVDADYERGAEEAQHAEQVHRIREGMRPGCVVAVADLRGMVDDIDDVPAGQRVWFNGPVGWLFAPKVHRLEQPVACRGAQGLWELPPDVERLVVAQLPKAVAA